jgi:hypothetical protein
MKDSQIRAIVLQKFYDKRRGDFYQPLPDEFAEEPDYETVMHICDQLDEIGLIDWKAVRMQGMTVQGAGKITAAGIDVIETDGKKAPVEFTFPVSQNFTFNSPSNVQVGNHNVQNIQQVLSDLVSRIEATDATTEEKEEAKGLLRSFLEHPLVGAIVGGLAGSIPGLLQ